MNLGDAIDQTLPWIVALARGGFFVRDRDAGSEDAFLHVEGAEDLETTERLATDVLKAALRVEMHAQWSSPSALRLHVLQVARERLTTDGKRRGRAASIASEKTTELRSVPDIDRLLETQDALTEATLAPFEQDAHVERDAASARAILAETDEVSRAVVELTFQHGEAEPAVAKALGISIPRVRACTRRVRSELQRAIRRQEQRRVGPAWLDAVLAGTAHARQLAPQTRTRIKRNVLRGTHTEEPKPFAVRLSWALGAVIMALVAALFTFSIGA